MDYEEVTCNSTKTKSKPQLKSDGNWEFQCRSLFWKWGTQTLSKLWKNRYNDGGKPQKDGQQPKGKEKSYSFRLYPRCISAMIGAPEPQPAFLRSRKTNREVKAAILILTEVQETEDNSLHKNLLLTVKTLSNSTLLVAQSSWNAALQCCLYRRLFGACVRPGFLQNAFTPSEFRALEQTCSCSSTLENPTWERPVTDPTPHLGTLWVPLKGTNTLKP